MKWNLLNTKCYTLILFSVYLCLPLFLASQTDYDNHRKYWYYRSRLVNDFMKVGLGQGESMIFNQRGLYAQDFNDQIARLNIGDGTSTLGLYIVQQQKEIDALKKEIKK